MDNLPASSFLSKEPKFNLCTRITVVVFWCLALVGLVCSIFLLKDVEQDVVQQRQAVIERFAYRVEWAMFDALAHRGPQDLTQKLESLARRFGVNGVKLHFDNKILVIGDTGPDLDNTSRNIYMDRPDNTRQMAAATITLYFPTVNELVKSKRNRVMFTMGLVLLVFGAALQRMLSQVLTKPMRQMVSVAQAVSKGEMTRRFDDSSGDEFGYLGGFINQALGELSYQAAHDLVTGLYNRREFNRHLHRALQTAQRDGQSHGLCYLDLDRFKLINDTCGHTAGDEFLLQLSHHLQQHMRKSDVLARLGGDEFAVLLQHCPLTRATEVAEELLQTIQEFRFVWEHKCFQVGVSIGLVEIASTSENVVELMNNADMACYAAKEAGRNRVHLYQHDDSQVSKYRGERAIATQLIAALDEDRMRVFFQPIRALSDGQQTDRYELLLRMLDSDGVLLEPDRFIPTAERFDLMPALDRWVVEQACELLKDCSAMDWNPVLMINISGKSLADETFLEFVLQAISGNNISPNCLCFEITEAAAIANLTLANRFMSHLHEMGCCFALDDFGSGLSSFAYLKNLPVDYLKIDGSFVRNISTSEVDRAMVKAINHVGHVLGMKTIAEFVDQAAVVDVLRELGVDYAQGYWISEPQPLQQLRDSGATDNSVEPVLQQARGLAG